MHKITLSKYPFIKGTQCEKSLWLHYNKPELKSPPTIEQQMLFDKGKEVGLLARELYPGGIDLSEDESLNGEKLLFATQAAFKTQQQIFYEAGFQSSDLYEKRKLFCKVD